jgi:uncharacterized protein YndB with AHSA1/START domain
MATPVDIQAENERELVLARRMSAPAEALYRCWTDPALIPKWFAPAPLTTEVLAMDVRPGGVQTLVMREPDGGAEYPAGGVYLELVPGRKLVFTDAFAAGWKPTDKPFFTGEISFEDLGGGESLYVARARHWSAEDAKSHAEMGFHDGWGLCAQQLEDVAKAL